MEDEPRIVEAVGTASGSQRPGLAQALEAAQTAALEQAFAEGVSIDDTEELIYRKAEARELVKAHWAATVEDE